MRDAFRTRDDDPPLFSLALGVPALIGWIGYGLAVLLAPHLAATPNPLLWAAIGAAGWYFLCAVFTVGPWALLLLERRTVMSDEPVEIPKHSFGGARLMTDKERNMLKDARDFRREYMNEFPTPTKTCEFCRYAILSFAAVRADPDTRKCSSLKSPFYRERMPLAGTCDNFEMQRK